MTDYARTAHFYYGTLPDERIHLVQFAHFLTLCGRPATYALFSAPSPSHVCPDCLKVSQEQGLTSDV